MTAVITALILIGVFLVIVLVGSLIRAARNGDERLAPVDDDAEQDADDRALEQEKDRLYGGGW